MFRLKGFLAGISRFRRRFTPALNQVFLAGVVLVYIYSRAEGDALPSFMLYSLAGVLLLAWVWNSEAWKRLKYQTRIQTQRSQVGGTLSLEVELENGALLSVPWLELQLELPPEFQLTYGSQTVVTGLRRGEKRSFTYHITCNKRGLYGLGSARLRSGDLFGIFVRSKAMASAKTVIVYPKIIELERAAVPAFQILGSSSVLRSASEDLTGPTGARRYAQGDPVNRIHWRATARTGLLQVKEYDLHTAPELGIFLNLSAGAYSGLPDQVVETAVTAAASLADYCFRRRLRYGLVSNGLDLYVQPPSRDAGQLLKSMEHLALAELGESSFEHAALLESRSFVPGTTLLFVTPVADERLGGTFKILRQRGYAIAVVQVGPAREKPEYLTGISYFAGIEDENLARVLGGEPLVRYAPGAV